MLLFQERLFEDVSKPYVPDRIVERENKKRIHPEHIAAQNICENLITDDGDAAMRDVKGSGSF